ncbi:uncharacterized protein LOC110976840 [Acanthaster planci]|uniref:Uncharacterized protein LOC110976840 n=1 Tax=Acanthaster planci TaxID=133434 RepID=A0A8B7Y2K6_ACAPL|nr:uncharacterized protein LOC110976840 [Acanthaster planci]
MAAPVAELETHVCAQSFGKLVDHLPHGERTFYTLPQKGGERVVSKKNVIKFEEITEICSYINNSVIGRESTFYGPFGKRKVVYCDYTASGRSLDMIEDYIRSQVLPLYGNTHTTTTVTSLQTTLYRHEARDIIRNSVNANEHDAVIFVGTGCTAAIHKLIHCLHPQAPPVVFVGPFEHHSNLLPWREIGAKVVRIPEDADGLVDTNCLEAELKKWHTSGHQLIGCFSAASNITGILTDDIKVTVMLHQYGAFAFWDFATAGPYVDINMNPVYNSGGLHSLAYKDAIFLSPHKFVGGVETPGILVAKKALFRNPVPSDGGGGSVFFVSHEDHRYLKQVEMREEGGTPSIVGAIRAGLVFQLKAALGADSIMSREQDLCRRAFGRWSGCSSLVLLGNTAVPRLPIFSFLIRHPTTGQFLHHNFVCAVLNDVFGIQARGGCACAGPYAQDLLGIDLKLAKEIEAVLLEDSRLDRIHLRRYTEYSEREILRPGFTRLNLPYFMDDECVEFVLDAVSLTAQHAWKLLPQYIFNPETGEWKQRNHQVFQDRRWLGSISYSEGKIMYPDPPVLKTKGRLPADYKDCLRLGEEIFKKAEKVRVQLPDQSLLFDSKAADLRWFMLPSEARSLLSNKSLSSHSALRKKLPFEPVKYKQKKDPANAFDSKMDEKRHCGSGCSMVGSVEETLGTTQPTSECFTSDNTESQINSECIAMEVSHDACNQLSCAELFRNTVEDGFTENAYNDVEIRQGHGNDPSTTPNQMVADAKGQIEHKEKDIAVRKTPSSKSDESLSTENAKNDKQSSVSRTCLLTSCDDAVVSSGKTCNIIKHHSAYQLNKPAAAITRKACRDGNTEKLKSGTIQSNCNQPSFSVEKRTADPVVDNTRDTLSGVEQTLNSIPSWESSTPALGLRADLSDSSHNLQRTENESNGCSGCCPNMNDSQEVTGTSEKHWSVDVKREQCRTNSTEQTYKISQRIPLPQSVNSPHDLCSEELTSSTEKLKLSKDQKSGVAGRVSGFQRPPKCIFKPTVQALEEYKMIQDGDRVLVCLSGGKDSLSLLHTLRQYQFYAKSKGIRFELGGVTVDPQTSAYDPRPLIPYLANLRMPYFFEEQCIIDTAAGLEGGCDSICSFCSRMKRGRLYACARREGYNVLAMGQHLDDLAESFLMSVFHNGLLRTMKANYTVKEGDLRVIRPFVYTREKDLRDFAEKAKLPVIPENCPACFEAPKERHRTKQLLASQELLFPRLYNSLQAAMKPLMAKNKTGMESSRKKEDFFEESDI